MSLKFSLKFELFAFLFITKHKKDSSKIWPDGILGSVADLVYSRGSEEPEQYQTKKQPSSGIALPKSKKFSAVFTKNQTFANFITMHAGGSVKQSFAKQIAQVHDVFDSYNS